MRVWPVPEGLKQMAEAGHDRTAALYTRLATRFGRQQMESEQDGYLVVARAVDHGRVDPAIFAQACAA